MGLTEGGYEAFCFDQAVAYFGTWVENELDKVSHKPSKKERQAMQARNKRLEAILNPEKKGQAQFADPAAFFK